MGSGSSTTNVSTVLKDAEGRRRINIQQMQNVLLIWLDSNIDETNDDYQNTMTKLRRAVSAISTYTNDDQCLEFIQTVVDNKIFMIISGSLGQHIVPRVHSMSQVDSIFIFCGNKKHHEQWAKDWPKIKGVFTDITPICEALKGAAHQCEQNVIPMSFVETNKKLDQLDPSFMYTQIMKEIILTIQFEQKHIQDYIDYCRDAFSDNEEEIENVKRLECQYHNETPIYWYTCQMFLYPMLNRALRLMNGDIITRMGFFIGDLHRQIEQLHQDQYAGTTAADTFTVYRGQGFSTGDFEKMSRIKGGLISFNNFLSTSKDRNISLSFAQDAAINPDQVGVFFIMEINPALSTTPFAAIADISDFQKEDEVLFSMHSVFRIQDIELMAENNRLYEVSLTLTADNDLELKRLTDYIREESFPNEEGWYRLGMVLWKIGQYDKAADFCQALLDQTKDNGDKTRIYHQLGLIKCYQKKYQEAIKFHKKSLAIKKKTLFADHPGLAVSYNNIGYVYDKMSDYPKALSFYEKALKIGQKTIFIDRPSLALYHSNVGLAHYNMGNYPKALSYIENALQIGERSLFPEQFTLATSYHNLGYVYQKMGDYPKALSSHEKAIKIRQKLLPPNHPHLADSYNKIGNVHFNANNYLEALSYYEKVLEMLQQSLPSNHPYLASCYNNIGSPYEKIGNYSKARTFFEHAVHVGQQSLASNDPDLQEYRNNLERVKNK
ncbi:unnamed protein product [Adineta steineri]|uniref:CRIB domain-containing protein n=1 Tax=Adineta steineri TaxID=433720 RepID=A0A819Z1M4_9BILA|nr:unnamed protein product [Adineta steineri]CAF1052246.1 unnamed protein product [Adineta steineri]CAF3602819.1 unnamed protein product [Adineta steineri]CAF4164091.1 unnamed protein product [Adineta steineri]